MLSPLFLAAHERHGRTTAEEVGLHRLGLGRPKAVRLVRQRCRPAQSMRGRALPLRQGYRAGARRPRAPNRLWRKRQVSWSPVRPDGWGEQRAGHRPTKCGQAARRPVLRKEPTPEATSKAWPGKRSAQRARNFRLAATPLEEPAKGGPILLAAGAALARSPIIPAGQGHKGLDYGRWVDRSECAAAAAATASQPYQP